MPANVPKSFSSIFSWWAVITAIKCQVQIIHIDFGTFEIGVVGNEIGKERFREAYNLTFNRYASLISTLLER